MKFFHVSDLHLDSPMTTRLDSAKVRERKNELLISFKRLTDSAEAKSAQAIIISGDLFDSERIGKRTLKNVVEIINAHSKIFFYYLPGNHERDVLKSSGITLPENLFIFGSEWTYFKLNGCNIIGRSDIRSDMFSDIKLAEDEKNILVLHGELRDRCDDGYAIGKADLESLPVDYVALGHYHSYSSHKISNRCTAVYCGTPEPRGFDESAECGYSEIDLSATAVGHKFVKSAKRRFHIIEVDISDCESDIATLYKLERSIAAASRDDLVRIVLTGALPLGKRIKTDTLASSLQHSFYYVEIKDETHTKISADDFKNDISLKGEFIRSVISDGSLTDKEKNAIINLGLEVLYNDER